MAQLTISDDLDAQAQQAADRLGFTKEDFISFAIQETLDYEEAPLTEAQIALLVKRAKQPASKEPMSSEEVELFFEDWIRELESR